MVFSLVYTCVYVNICIHACAPALARVCARAHPPWASSNEALLPTEAKFFDSSASVLRKGRKFSSAANVSYLFCLAWASESCLWCDIQESLRKWLFEYQGRAVILGDSG